MKFGPEPFANRHRELPAQERARATLVSLAEGLPIVTPRLYSAPVGGVVETFYEWADQAYFYTQPTAANRAPTPTPGAAFRGAPTARFVKSPGTFYVSNRPVSYWQAWNDGTPRTSYRVFAPKSLAGNSSIDSLGRTTGPTDQVTLTSSTNGQWYTGGSVRVIDTGLVVDVARWAKQARSGNSFSARWNGKAPVAGTSTASALPPNGPSTIGSTTPNFGVNFADMEWAGLFNFPWYLDAAKDAAVEQALQVLFGVAP